MKTDRLREALAWAVGFIRCQHPNAYEEYEDMRNAVSLVEGPPGAFGEFFRMSCRAEVAESVVAAVVSGLGLKNADDIRSDPALLGNLIAGLQAEADLYRRGYDAIGACDIGNYLARCAEAGKTLER